MNVDTLKAELEEHLAKNPDERAPHGFRDRFDTLVEHYNSEEDEAHKSALEAELQQIRAEAEAAWTCCATPRADAPPAPPADAVTRPGPPVDARGAIETADTEVSLQAAGFAQRYGVALVAALVVLAAAYYFFVR